MMQKAIYLEVVTKYNKNETIVPHFGIIKLNIAENENTIHNEQSGMFDNWYWNYNHHDVIPSIGTGYFT